MYGYERVGQTIIGYSDMLFVYLKSLPIEETRFMGHNDLYRSLKRYWKKKYCPRLTCQTYIT